MTIDESAGTGKFTTEQVLYYGYLRRRRSAGEVGSRTSMGNVMVAHNKLQSLLGEHMVLDEAGAPHEQAEITVEMQALCDLLYLEVSTNEPGGEDAPV